MNAIVKCLSEEARKLTPDERVELVEEVLATLASTDAEIEQAWAAEAKDRLEAYRRGEMQARDFDEIMRKYDRSLAPLSSNRRVGTRSSCRLV